jgi:hypothetical protein
VTEARDRPSRFAIEVRTIARPGRDALQAFPRRITGNDFSEYVTGAHHAVTGNRQKTVVLVTLDPPVPRRRTFEGIRSAARSRLTRAAETRSDARAAPPTRALRRNDTIIESKVETESDVIAPNSAVPLPRVGARPRNLTGASASGSLPASRASRRALSRSISARSASRTSAVRSCVPVSRWASRIRSSSRLMVVRIGQHRSVYASNVLQMVPSGGPRSDRAVRRSHLLRRPAPAVPGAQVLRPCTRPPRPLEFAPGFRRMAGQCRRAFREGG